MYQQPQNYSPRCTTLSYQKWVIIKIQTTSLHTVKPSLVLFILQQPICLPGTQPQNMIQIFALTTNSRVNLSVYMMVFHCLFLNSDCRNITTTINACLLRIKGFTVLLLRSVLSSQIWKGMATCKASGRVLLGRVVSVP